MSKQQDMEKTTNNIITIEEVQNTIPQLIEDFCIQNKIEDLHKESNNIFMSCLLYINKQLIQPNEKTLLKYDHGTNNQTDYNKLYSLLEIYINLCMMYDATVTILGFSCFTGLERATIYELQNKTKPQDQYNNITKTLHKADPQSKTGLNIWQKLIEYEELTTLNCRKYNDLRIIARLNRITGGAYRDYTQVDTGESKPMLTADEIQQKYGAIADNTQ